MNNCIYKLVVGQFFLSSQYSREEEFAGLAVALPTTFCKGGLRHNKGGDSRG